MKFSRESKPKFFVFIIYLFIYLFIYFLFIYLFIYFWTLLKLAKIRLIISSSLRLMCTLTMVFIISHLGERN